MDDWGKVRLASQRARQQFYNKNMSNHKLTFELHVQSECLCLLGYFAH